MAFMLLTIIILGTGGKLQSEALGTLLGTISGYVFGKMAHRDGENTKSRDRDGESAKSRDHRDGESAKSRDHRDGESAKSRDRDDRVPEGGEGGSGVSV